MGVESDAFVRAGFTDIIQCCHVDFLSLSMNFDFLCIILSDRDFGTVLRKLGCLKEEMLELLNRIMDSEVSGSISGGKTNKEMNVAGGGRVTLSVISPSPPPQIDTSRLFAPPSSNMASMYLFFLQRTLLYIPAMICRRLGVAMKLS